MPADASGTATETYLPRIGVVIVNWNRGVDTVRCIASVLASDYPCFELVLVDNGSTDRSADVIQQVYPELPILRNLRNLGFTGGYNTGIREVLRRGVDYVFLLNNDAVLEPSALTLLAKAAMAHPTAGFLGPVICTLEDRRTILSAGGTLLRGWKPCHRAIGEVDKGQFDTVTEVDYLSGCALLVSRKAIDTVGLLDEDYFAYHEDIDWCYRGKQAGFKVLVVPQAKIWHPDTRRRDENSPLVTYYVARNSLLFAKKHRFGAIVLLRMFFQYLRVLTSWTVRPRWRYKRRQRDALARALLHFMLGRAGEMGPL
ncbi:MAG: glycosyltransferase family 2 protein [Candidatus Methanomethyliaceae archaeon]